MNKIINSTYKYGIESEKFVESYLLKLGFSILFNRYKTPYGEIDLILNNETTVIFAEVKARRKNNKEFINQFQTLDSYEELISSKQISRIKNAASVFLSQNHQYRDKDIQIDIILVNHLRIEQHFRGVG